MEIADTQGEHTGAINLMSRPGPATMLLFRTGLHMQAIPIEFVIETMRVLPVEPVAGVPSYVAGLSIIRGSPVPVIDTGRLFNDVQTRGTRLITVKAGERTVALLVEAVVGIRAFSAETLEQLPPLVGGASAEAFSAIGAMDARLMVVLCAAKIIPEAVFLSLEAQGADL